MDSTAVKPNLNMMLKAHMGYMAKRQEVLAQNIANIDTPGYKARDLKKLNFEEMANAAAAPSRLSLRTTSPKHIEGTLGPTDNGFKTIADRNTFEISPDKNNVVLEDQMAKVSDTGAQFQLSSTMMRKFTQLYRTAAGNK